MHPRATNRRRSQNEPAHPHRSVLGGRDLGRGIPGGATAGLHGRAELVILQMKVLQKKCPKFRKLAIIGEAIRQMKKVVGKKTRRTKPRKR